MRRALTALMLFALAACGRDEGDETYVRVAFDGAAWSATAGPAQIAYSVDHPDDYPMYTAIAARRAGSTEQLFSLGLPVPLALGTYALDGHGDYAAYLSCPNETLMDCAYWSTVGAHPGTLTISALDPEAELVTGTFAFNGYFLGDSAGSAKSFTAGAFRIKVPGGFTPE